MKASKVEGPAKIKEVYVKESRDKEKINVREPVKEK